MRTGCCIAFALCSLALYPFSTRCCHPLWAVCRVRAFSLRHGILSLAGAEPVEEISKMSGIEEKIHALPPELQQEVEDFVLFLMERSKRNERGAPALAWAGALKAQCGSHDSVELQHAISQWM